MWVTTVPPNSALEGEEEDRRVKDVITHDKSPVEEVVKSV